MGCAQREDFDEEVLSSVHSVQHSRAKELPFKMSHKLSQDAVDLIVELSSEGYSDQAICSELKSRFNVAIHRNSIGYYRKKKAVSIAQRSKEALTEAMVESSLTSLAGRLVKLESIFEMEKKKGEDADIALMVRVLRIADTMVSRVQSLALKSREIELSRDQK